MRGRGDRTSGGSSSIPRSTPLPGAQARKRSLPSASRLGLRAIGAGLPTFWWGFRRVLWLWLWLGGCGHGLAVACLWVRSGRCGAVLGGSGARVWGRLGPNARAWFGLQRVEVVLNFGQLGLGFAGFVRAELRFDAFLRGVCWFPRVFSLVCF